MTFLSFVIVQFAIIFIHLVAFFEETDVIMDLRVLKNLPLNNFKELISHKFIHQLMQNIIIIITYIKLYKLRLYKKMPHRIQKFF